MRSRICEYPDYSICPGDGYVWDFCSQKWITPKTVNEFNAWCRDSFWGLKEGDDFYSDFPGKITSEKELQAALRQFRKPPITVAVH